MYPITNKKLVFIKSPGLYCVFSESSYVAVAKRAGWLDLNVVKYTVSAAKVSSFQTSTSVVSTNCKPSSYNWSASSLK